MSAQKMCLGCGRIGAWGNPGRCPPCRRARVNMTERNPARRMIKAVRYGPEHERLRARFDIAIRSGVRVLCARCRLPIGPLDKWDLDHLDGVSHPSHARHNRQATTRKRVTR